jgi:signal peptidase I
MGRIISKFLDVIEFFVSSAAIAILLYLFVMQPHQVNGSSMDPNFHDGELLLTDKLTYRFQPPERGDVVIFSAPPQAYCPAGLNCDFIKRVIALPGERVMGENGEVFINGRVLKEPYERSIPKTTAGLTGSSFLPEGIERVVPEGSFVVFGDNRGASSDSREWGPVEMRRIIGKVRVRYWPPDAFGVLAFERAVVE